MGSERYNHFFKLGVKDARNPLYGHWSPNALLQGYGDGATMTNEEVQAYKDGYSSVRGVKSEAQELALDDAQNARINEFLEWEKSQNTGSTTFVFRVGDG